jgi:tetratricopeptide (TPR) repeat protein
MKQISKDKPLIVLKTLGYYFRNMIFPSKVGMFHKYLHNYGLTDEETKEWHNFDVYALIGLILMVFFLFMGNYVNHASKGLFWWLLFMAQWSNFMVINHPITERYSYLANVGLMYCLANVLMAFPSPYCYILSTIFIVYYATKLWDYMPAYRNNFYYMKANIDNFPDHPLAHNQYGLELAGLQRIGSAIEIWQEGLKLRPHDFRLNYNLANVLATIGDVNNAMKFLPVARESLDKDQSNYDTWVKNMDTIQAKIDEVLKCRSGDSPTKEKDVDLQAVTR